MPESTNITLSRAMPLDERILKVNKQLSEWLQSLDKPFNDERDVLQLKKHVQSDKNFTYHYIIERDAISLKRNR